MRSAKIKNLSDLRKLIAHATRSEMPPNAQIGVANKVLIGDNPYPDICEVLDNIPNKRKNANIAIEHVMTASPDFFKTATKAQKNQWLKQSMKWLKDEYGEHNVAYAVLHLDEKTPHISAFVIPTVYENDTLKLASNRWQDGPAKMKGQQDSYYEYVKKCGLDRGIKGSKAKHQAVKRGYGALEGDVPEWKDAGFWDWKTKADNEHAFQQLKDLANLHRITQWENQGLRRTAHDLSNKLDKAEAHGKTVEAERDKLKETLDNIRRMDLTIVAKDLGLLFNDKKKQWTDIEGNFAINLGTAEQGAKGAFHCKKTEQSGGGAIDFVKFCMDCDFQTAKAWLLDRYGAADYIQEAATKAYKEAQEAAAKEVKRIRKEQPKVFTPPSPSKAKWPAVRNYLASIRGLPQIILGYLHHKGTLYADSKANAVFASERGASLRGTYEGSTFRGQATGSDGKYAWTMEYSPETNDDKHSERWRHENLVITESPIDAISAATLFQARGTYASTAGLRGDIPTNIRNAAYGNIIIAYDSDAAGQAAAKKLKKAYLDLGHKNVEIVQPTAGCKDWNEVLCKHGKLPPKVVERYIPPATP
jgi:hypothetical protein